MAIEHERLRVGNIVEAQAQLSACELQIAIYKTLEESDSALDALKLNRQKSTTETNDETNDNSNESGKTESAMVDDLKSLNHELHILIFNLMSKIDESIQDSVGSRERLKLSDGKDKCSQQKLPTSKSSSKSSIRSDEQIERRSISGEERKIVLPDTSELPPLELPEFDYSTFDEKIQD